MISGNSFRKGVVYEYLPYEGYYLVPIFKEDDFSDGYWYRDCYVVDAAGNKHAGIEQPLVRFDISLVKEVIEPPVCVYEFMRGIQA